MKTVKELIAELQKFPEDAQCYAYEGEDTGVCLQFGLEFGFIYCSSQDEIEEKPSELFTK